MATIERHKNYQDLGATVDNPKYFLNEKHLRNSRHPFAADGWKEKEQRVERFADMVDYEGVWVSEEAYEALIARVEEMFNRGEITQEIAEEYKDSFLEVREVWENLRARIADLHEQGLIEVDEKGYPINPNRWAHDIEGMGELWEWGPIMASTAAVTTKVINPETGIEETYLWCVMKEGEDVWRLPGGSIEKDEIGMYKENPVQAGIRETLEESGLDVGSVPGSIKFKGISTGGRQTKHSWFQDHLIEFELKGGLSIEVKIGSDESIRDSAGSIIEKKEISKKGWQKITPEFLENFSESHLRMLREAGIVESIEDRQEADASEKR